MSSLSVGPTMQVDDFPSFKHRPTLKHSLKRPNELREPEERHPRQKKQKSQHCSRSTEREGENRENLRQDEFIRFLDYLWDPDTKMACLAYLSRFIDELNSQRREEPSTVCLAPAEIENCLLALYSSLPSDFHSAESEAKLKPKSRELSVQIHSPESYLLTQSPEEMLLDGEPPREFSPPQHSDFFPEAFGPVLPKDTWLEYSTTASIIGRITLIDERCLLLEESLFCKEGLKRLVSITAELACLGKWERFHITALEEFLESLGLIASRSYPARAFLFTSTLILEVVSELLTKPNERVVVQTLRLLSILTIFNPEISRNNDEEDFDTTNVSLCDKGVIDPLVSLLTDNTPQITMAVCCLLSNISTNNLDSNQLTRDEICKQCLKPILKLINTTNEEILPSVLWLAHKMSWNVKMQNELSYNGAFDRVIELLSTSENLVVMEIASLVFSDLSVIGNDRNFVSLTTGGGIKAILQLFQSEDRNKKALAVRCLSAISAPSTPRAKEHQSYFCAQNGIDLLLRSLKEESFQDEMIFQSTLYGLCTISPSNYTEKQKTLAYQICFKVLGLPQKDKKMTEAICWYIHKLAIPENQTTIGQSGGFQEILKLLKHDDERVMSCACWVFIRLAARRENWGNEGIDCAREGILRILSLLSHLSLKVQVLACKAIRILCINHPKGGIDRGNTHSSQNQLFIGQNGGIESLLKLLRSDKEILVETAYWALAALSHHKENQIIMINSNALELFWKGVESQSDKISEGAAFCLINSITKDTLPIIPEEIGIPSFVKLLEHPNDRIFERACLGLSKLVSPKSIQSISRHGCIAILISRVSDAPFDPALIGQTSPKEVLLEHFSGCIASLASNDVNNIVGLEPFLIQTLITNLHFNPENERIVNRTCFALNILAISDNSECYTNPESVIHFGLAMEKLSHFYSPASVQFSRFMTLISNLVIKLEDFFVSILCNPRFTRCIVRLAERDLNCKSLILRAKTSPTILKTLATTASLTNSPLIWEPYALLAPPRECMETASKIATSIKAVFLTQPFNQALFQDFLIAYSSAFWGQISKKSSYPVEAHGATRPDVDQFTQVWNLNLFHDITIQIGEELIPCHKVVLSVGSQYFEKLLTVNMKEKYQNIITLHEIDAEEFRKILRFLYLRTITFESHFEAFETLMKAHEYQILQLEALCVQCLTDHMTIESALDILCWTSSICNPTLKPLQESAAGWVCRNFVRIREQPEQLDKIDWQLLYNLL